MKDPCKEKALPAGQHPWLLCYHGKGNKNHTFCSNISEPARFRRTYEKRIPVLHGKKVFSCSFGWLVLHDDENNLFSLCDASTLETLIDLPNSKYLKCNHNLWSPLSCILSASPNNPDCRVLLFICNLPSILLCRIGDEEWTEISYHNQLKSLHLEHRIFNGFHHNYYAYYFDDPIICGGKLYACAARVFKRFWFMIEIVEEPVVGLLLTYLNDGPHWKHGWPYPQVQYVESCGQLFAINLARGHQEILGVEVCRLNSDSMIWERVNNIKGRAFYLSYKYCFSCSKEGSGYIYFTQSEDPSVFCYNLEDESISKSLKLPKHYDRLPLIWILPEVEISAIESRASNEDGNYQAEAPRKKIKLDFLKKGSSANEEEQMQRLQKFLRKDMVQEISKHFTILDYMNFRIANRMCREVAPLMNWGRAFSESQNKLCSPLLMFADKDQGIYKFVDPRLDITQSYLIRTPDSLEDTMIRYSSNGRVLLSRGNNSYIYNPCTKEVISSPEMENDWDSGLFFTSKPSTASNCYIVEISFENDKFISALVINVADEDDSNSFDILAEGRFTPIRTSPVIVHDALYFTDDFIRLGVFKLGQDNQMSWQVLDQIQLSCQNYSQQFLAECGGELLLILVGSEGKWLLVFKLNQCQTAWENVKSLGNYALYISRSSSISVPAPPGMQNRIYFPILRDLGVVFYSLDTEKWHSSGSQYSFTNFCATRLLLNSCWIQPSWGR